MKIIKRVLLILIVLIVGLLIAGLFVSKELNYEKTITINAPMEKVWQNVNSLHKMNNWTPWQRKDKAMKQTFTGKEGEVGSEYCWDSQNEEVGKGCQKITKIDTIQHRLETELNFMKPFESQANAYVQLVEKGNTTDVTWGFKSEMPYPFNLMMIFIDMEKGMDADFGAGLSNLKNICE